MPILTEAEREMAIQYYDFGWSFQEIIARLSELRNEELKRDMLREVGILVFEHYKKKAYPIEFYGVLGEE